MPTIIHFDDLEPGMVLGSPILNRYGQTLLAAGVVLDERHLLMFKTWGIKHITIEGDHVKKDGPKKVNDDIMNLARTHVQKRLLWTDLSPIEEDLFNAAVERVIDIYSSSQLEGNE